MTESCHRLEIVFAVWDIDVFELFCFAPIAPRQGG